MAAGVRGGARRWGEEEGWRPRAGEGSRAWWRRCGGDEGRTAEAGLRLIMH